MECWLDQGDVKQASAQCSLPGLVMRLQMPSNGTKWKTVNKNASFFNFFPCTNSQPEQI
jgi:hypothetical protein